MSSVKNMYSMKVIVHKVSLAKAAFDEKRRPFSKASIRVKFVDFPVMSIDARRELSYKEFKKQQLLATYPLPNAFAKGKSVCLHATTAEMGEYLRSYALIVQMKNYDESNSVERTIGKCLVDMDMFLEDSRYVITDEIERFRRNTFTLVNRESTCVGWIDLSISLLQRPLSYLTKSISKKIGSLESSQVISPPQNNSKVNSTIGERLFSLDENIQNTRNSKEITEQSNVHHQKLIHKNSSAEEQTPSVRSEWKSPALNPNNHSSSYSNNQNQNNNNTSNNAAHINYINHFQSSNEDYYLDDFEASSVQNVASIKHSKPSKKSAAFDESDAGTDKYDEDFESMSASYGVSVGSIPKRNSIGNISQGQGRRKSGQQEILPIKPIDDDAISEVYTEDFESMSLSASVQKSFPKSQKLLQRK